MIGSGLKLLRTASTRGRARGCPVTISRFLNNSTQQSHYQVLGVPVDATDAEIKAAFVRLSKKHHPDLSADKNAHQQFVRINEAYSVLSRPASRREYDALTRGSPGSYTTHSRRPWDPQPFEDRWPGPPHHPPYPRGFRRKSDFKRRPGESTEEMYRRWYWSEYGSRGSGPRPEGFDETYRNPNDEKILFPIYTVVGMVAVAMLFQLAIMNRRQRVSRMGLDEQRRYWMKEIDKSKPKKDASPPSESRGR